MSNAKPPRASSPIEEGSGTASVRVSVSKLNWFDVAALPSIRIFSEAIKAWISNSLRLLVNDPVDPVVKFR